MWARINKSGKSEYRKVYLEDIDMSHTWTRKVPTSIKLHYDAKDVEWLTEDHCFVIGHYLAEGWKEEHKVTTSGREIPDHIIPKLDALEIPYSLYSNNSGVPCLRFLKSEFKTYLHGFTMGSFKLKMPDELLNLPENKLQKLLDGYFLGDGHHHVQGGKKEMIYSTSSPDLVI